MRKIISILALALAVASCNKDNLDIVGNKENKVSFTFKVEPAVVVETKAEAIGTGDDDKIERLDLFEYRKSTGELLAHKVWTDPNGIDISTIEYTSYDSKNNSHSFLVLANFDEASMNYFATLDGKEIGNCKIGILPLQTGLFRSHKSLMGGVNGATFSKSETREITLRRYITRIEIEKITANFDDLNLMNCDVKLKTVALTGVTNVLRPLHEVMTDVTSDSHQDVYGVGVGWTSSPGFGGLTSGHIDFNDLSENSWVDFTTTFNIGAYGATGVLANDYHYVLNDNRLLDAGVLNIDVTGDMLESTCQYIPSGEGVLASSAGAVPHTYNLNKQFYTYNLDRNSYSYLYGDWSSQDNTQKLVLEVEINGETNFYIIRMMGLCPNTIYKVHNITLRGLGSIYSNKYVQRYTVKSTAPMIDEWGNVEIDNIDIGYKESGTEVYSER